jgi:hypothetical protein
VNQRTPISIAWLSVCYQPSVRIRKYIFRDPDPRIRNPESWMGGQLFMDPDLDLDPTWTFLWPLEKICYKNFKILTFFPESNVFKVL